MTPELFQDCLTEVIAYHRAIDQGRASEGLQYFAPDAHFEAKGTVFQGHAEISDFLSTREKNTSRQTLHVIANASPAGSQLEPAISAFVVLYAKDSSGGYQFERVLDTTHHFQELDGRWVISARHSRPLHADPA